VTKEFDGENMTDAQATNEAVAAPIQSLPGFISISKRSSGSYGFYCRNTYVKEGKVFHDREYLGKIIDQDQNLFYNRKKGYFTFDLVSGYGEVAPNVVPELYAYPKLETLHFGDIWMVDQVMKRLGLTEVLENLIPEAGDTVKALVAFRLLDSNGYDRAESWFTRSYARVLYPNSRVSSSMTSKYHAMLGQEEVFYNFFRSYLSIITKDNDLSDKISLPVLIDSTGLPNDIKTYLTARNKHNGVVSNEMRLIYIVDAKTKLPIFFRYVPGNIIDNTTLIGTVNHLAMHNIFVESVLMDAGYSGLHNLKEMKSVGIDFITRIPKNRKEYKQLFTEHGKKLECPVNIVTYGDRSLFAKRVKIKMGEMDIYAFLMLDHRQRSDEINYLSLKYNEDPEREVKIAEKFESLGKFILLSSKEYEINEILPLYYSRQTIEQTFDVSKNFADILPLRAHSEETIRGRLMLSFMATILYIIINQQLNGTKLSTSSAISEMFHLQIRIYEAGSILQELTKLQKEIFSKLNLDSPFSEARNNLLKQNSFLADLKSNDKKRGRPKGSKNKVKAKTQISNLSDDSETMEPRRPGRPKGSKNRKVFQDQNPVPSDDSPLEASRRRGRPKGSRNKIKNSNQTVPNSEGVSTTLSKRRGRPKGSKNRTKPSIQPSSTQNI
jgi:hypothetical protein